MKQIRALQQSSIVLQARFSFVNVRCSSNDFCSHLPSTNGRNCRLGVHISCLRVSFLGESDITEEFPETMSFQGMDEKVQ